MHQGKQSQCKIKQKIKSGKKLWDWVPQSRRRNLGRNLSSNKIHFLRKITPNLINPKPKKQSKHLSFNHQRQMNAIKKITYPTQWKPMISIIFIILVPLKTVTKMPINKKVWIRKLKNRWTNKWWIQKYCCLSKCRVWVGKMEQWRSFLHIMNSWTPLNNKCWSLLAIQWSKSNKNLFKHPR